MCAQGRGQTVVMESMKQVNGLEEIRPHARGRELAPQASAIEGAGAHGASALRVLLAEDNVTNQLLARRVLEKRGHQVIVVENGAAAIAAAEREAFDLILMDVQMPELSGIDATVAIRRREAGTGRHIPIVALTAHAMKSDLEACLAAGMDAYLSKPVRAAELFATVERVLPAGPDPAATPAPEGEPPAVDRSALLAGTDGDVTLLELLVAMFPVEIPALVEAVRGAAQSRDAAGLARAAHRLKGALGNFAARRAVEHAARLEAMGQSGDLAPAAATLEELDRELARVRDALAQIVA